MTEHDKLKAATKRIAAFATLELGTPEPERLDCERGVHFIIVTMDMDGGTGWDCRSTFCGVHIVKLLRAIANTLEERNPNTQK